MDGEQQHERFSDRQLVDMLKDIAEIKATTSSLSIDMRLHLQESKQDHDLLLQHDVTLYGRRGDEHSEGGLTAMSRDIGRTKKIGWTAMCGSASAILWLFVEWVKGRLGIS